MEADSYPKIDFKLFDFPTCEDGFCMLLGINNKRVLGLNMAFFYPTFHPAQKQIS